jgi:hypothetical protein
MKKSGLAEVPMAIALASITPINLYKQAISTIFIIKLLYKILSSPACFSSLRGPDTTSAGKRRSRGHEEWLRRLEHLQKTGAYSRQALH